MCGGVVFWHWCMSSFFYSLGNIPNSMLKQKQNANVFMMTFHLCAFTFASSAWDLSSCFSSLYGKTFLGDYIPRTTPLLCSRAQCLYFIVVFTMLLFLVCLCLPAKKLFSLVFLVLSIYSISCLDFYKTLLWTLLILRCLTKELSRMTPSSYDPNNSESNKILFLHD